VSNVVSLSGDALPKMGEPNYALVQLLERMLEDARAGRLQSMVGTGFMADGLRAGFWADLHPNVYEMLGSIAWLHAEYIERHTKD